MSEIKDGGAAFPHGKVINNSLIYEGECGLSIRDYMASKALQGMLAYPGYESTGSHHSNNTPDGVAEMAYEYADAMLKARGQS